MPYQAKDNRYSAMRYNRCGRSGLKLPAISLGLWHNFGGVDPFASSRALVLAAVVESALADDVLIGTTALQWAALEGRTIDLFPYEKSWAAQLKLSVECNARLT